MDNDAYGMALHIYAWRTLSFWAETTSPVLNIMGPPPDTNREPSLHVQSEVCNETRLRGR